MDLITCRNLLIYLEPVLQRKIIPLFHYALKPQGVLWLGSSESIGNFADLFEVIDSKHKLYQKKPGATPVHVTVSLTPQRWGGQSFHAPHPRYGEGHLALDLQREADRLALAKYSPPAVLVNSDFDILQFRGDTSPYLAAAPGKPSVNVMKMAREGLLVGLRSTLQRAVKEGVPARQEGLLVKSNGGFREVNLEIVPVRSLDAEAGCYLIMFEPVGTISHLPATAIKDLPSSHLSQDDANRHINHLTQELATTREYLQSLIEQQEAANEELQAANEEVQSSNEELQSTNEELQTSKEEIQSSNEELTTVNEELSRRNEQLWQANSDLTNFLNSTELAIVMLDRQLHIHRFNGHAEKLFDLTAADVGKPIAKLRLPFDGSHLLSELSTVIESMRAKEFEVQDKEGHWYSLRLRPYRSHDHQVDGVLLVLVNIDTQKRTQFSLQQSENRLSLAIEGAGMGTWDTDLRSGESVWSASRFRNFGLPPAPGGRARLEMWFSQIHPDDLEHVKADMERAKREKSLFATEHRIIRADNQQVVWLQPFGRFYYDDAGQAVRFSGVSFDNTPRKLAEQALQQADRNKDRFLAMLAHELRNPLAPLRNALDLLRRGARGTASPNLAKTTLADKTGEAVALVDRAAGIMDRQADKLTRLVDDLLDITRINQGKIALHRELVDLRDIVPAAAESVEHQILAQGLKLNLALPTKPVYVAGDAVRLEQVLANLLINAAKYTERQGSIDVDLRATPLSPPSQGDTGGVAILRVSDTGIGIKPEQLPTIFELFTQGEDNGGRDQGGLGIGLSLVRQLVQLHGGTVEAFSAGVGKGSVFIIRLPLLSGAQIEQAKKRPSREETSPPALPPQRILVVDDNVDAADSLADLLKIFGHDVRVTYTGHSALEEAREFAPQVVLLDIGLPGMDGNEVCRRMLQRPETKQAIMVALTGYGNDDAYYRTKEAGFHSHLLKPVNAQDLLQILAKLAMRAGKKKS
jgi:two-component system CheB/CheR fusion protein